MTPQHSQGVGKTRRLVVCCTEEGTGDFAPASFKPTTHARNKIDRALLVLLLA